MVSPKNGNLPVSKEKVIIPTDHISQKASY